MSNHLMELLISEMAIQELSFQQMFSRLQSTYKLDESAYITAIHIACDKLEIKQAAGEASQSLLAPVAELLSVDRPWPSALVSEAAYQLIDQYRPQAPSEHAHPVQYAGEHPPESDHPQRCAGDA
ncbi:hypothetical protein [Thiothrix lacustris]|uniref:hypothetical protein n=1 Tax=Thiothrix lacustris TaxID=525917 RepID=UPI00048F7499|nr:hypothetical protein [Thiothrix lacustris]